MKKAALLFCLFPVLLFAQHRKIDSLAALVQKDKLDTNKVKHLNVLSKEYQNANLFDSAASVAESSLVLSEKLHFERGTADAHYNIGFTNRFQGHYTEAIKNLQLALKEYHEIGDLKNEAATYNYMGVVYRILGNYPEAINNQLNALKIKETIGDKKGAAASYNNIGNIYREQKDYDKALNYYYKALKINEETGNKTWMANNYCNIGVVYDGGYDNKSSALTNYMNALKIFEELNDKNGIATVCNNIGTVYESQKKFPEALTYYSRGLEIRKTIGVPDGICSSYLNLGVSYAHMHNYPAALFNLNNALNICKDLNSRDYSQSTYLALSELDSAMGNYGAAYQHYKLFVAYRDSMLNEEESKKTMQAQLSYEFNKKSAADSVKNAEQIKLNEVQTQGKLQQEKTKRYALYAGLALLFIFGAFMVNRFVIIRKQKKIIEIKNRETEQQKDIIEEKQKEIVDSINYAKRIQYALLAHEKLLWANLNHHFVLFKPKDIVSGDFYWATKVERVSPSGERISKFFLACCDSTGHGVPGAFMSLLNISFLNEAIIEKNILEPNEVLNHVRKRLIENTDGGSDGMDAILLCIDKVKNTITYSAAHNSPLLIQNGETKDLPCDKMPVGKGDKLEPFTLHTIDAQKGDSIYLFTDGYADQFGGPKGKKFKSKQLVELLKTNSAEPLKQQAEVLDREFEFWKGNLEQVDDVLIIGIKI